MKRERYGVRGQRRYRARVLTALISVLCAAVPCHAQEAPYNRYSLGISGTAGGPGVHFEPYGGIEGSFWIRSGAWWAARVDAEYLQHSTWSDVCRNSIFSSAPCDPRAVHYVESAALTVRTGDSTAYMGRYLLASLGVGAFQWHPEHYSQRPPGAGGAFGLAGVGWGAENKWLRFEVRYRRYLGRGEAGNSAQILIARVF